MSLLTRLFRKENTAQISAPPMLTLAQSAVFVRAATNAAVNGEWGEAFKYWNDNGQFVQAQVDMAAHQTAGIARYNKAMTALDGFYDELARRERQAKEELEAAA